METVQPIRDKETLENIKDYLKRTNARNYLLFCLGIYTGLRISDILKLRHEDIKDKEYIEVRETKTKKTRRVKVRPKLRSVIDDFYKCKELKNTSEKVFTFSRVQAYRIINDACRVFGVKDKIGTHTLRKTFGYHHYQKYKDVAVLQTTLGHSAPSVTLRYIGITDDLVDECMELDI
jgi:integrase